MSVSGSKELKTETAEDQISIRDIKRDLDIDTALFCSLMIDCSIKGDKILNTFGWQLEEDPPT